MSIFYATLNPEYLVMMLIQDFYVKLTHFFWEKKKNNRNDCCTRKEHWAHVHHLPYGPHLWTANNVFLLLPFSFIEPISDLLGVNGECERAWGDANASYA